MLLLEIFGYLPGVFAVYLSHLSFSKPFLGRYVWHHTGFLKNNFSISFSGGPRKAPPTLCPENTSSLWGVIPLGLRHCPHFLRPASPKAWAMSMRLALRPGQEGLLQLSLGPSLQQASPTSFLMGFRPRLTIVLRPQAFAGRGVRTTSRGLTFQHTSL